MGEENIDITFASEEIEPETGFVMKNTGSPLEEPIDNVDEQHDTDCSIATDEISHTVADKTSDVIEEGEETSVSKSLGGNSSAIIVGPDHKFTVRSRYRRASTGSCHDACKYGHKHELEKSSKKPVMATIREKKTLTRTSSDNKLAISVPVKETKSTELTRRISLPGPVLVKPVKDPPSHIEGKQLTPTKSKMKHVQTDVKSSSVRTPGSSFGRSKIDIPAVKKSIQGKSGQKVKEITAEEGNSTDGKKLKGKEVMVNSPRMPLKKSASIKAKLYKDLKSFSRSKRQSNLGNSEVNKSTDVGVKAPSAAKPLKSSLSNEASSSSQKETGSDKAKKSGVAKKVTRFGLPSFSTPSSSKSTAQPQGKYQQKSDSINTKPIGPKKEKGGSKTDTAGNVKTKAKSTGISRPEEKDGSAWKVKFRRGTIVNLQVASSSPRKLRFKRGRILGEDQGKADADKTLNTNDITNESPDTKPEHEKVHLRRQEGTGKKDSIDLNDVIEETASKLVKARKSKVKALVGAFETVMSFRDRKPLVETSAS